MGGNLPGDSGSKSFRYTVEIFIPMKVMAVFAFEILIGNFDFKTGNHYPDAPVVAPQDTAMAFLRILLCAVVPKASAGFVHICSQVGCFVGKLFCIQEPTEVFLTLVIVLKSNAVHNP